MTALQDVVIVLGPWSWWVLGIALLALEVVVPGMFFLWFGVAAIIVGAIGLVAAPLGFGQAWSWQVQSIAWAVLAILCVYGGRRWSQRADESEDPALNDRTRRYVGRVVALEEPIKDGIGRLRIEDTIWRIEGGDAPAGTHVEVTGAEGAVLRVRAASRTP